MLLQTNVTHIVMLIFWKEAEPFLQKDDHVVSHLIKITEIAIRIDIAETSAHGLIDKEEVRKLIPRTVVVLQVATFLHSVWSHLHHRAVHRGAAGPTV